jgi:hypothetical protein
MAFKPVNLVLWSNSPENNSPQGLPQWWAYKTVDDTAATVAGAGYFNNDPGSLLQTTIFNIGDTIYCVCSDTTVQLQITAVRPNITTSAFIELPNSVDTASIQNGAVTLAKLAAGITPSHVIKFANQVTTVGGAAAEAFVVAGAVAATDRAFVQVVNDGAANVTVLQAVVTANTLTVTFSANPGNDVVINYQIIRAAA